jgi:hypothetical protein
MKPALNKHLLTRITAVSSIVEKAKRVDNFSLKRARTGPSFSDP